LPDLRSCGGCGRQAVMPIAIDLRRGFAVCDRCSLPGHYVDADAVAVLSGNDCTDVFTGARVDSMAMAVIEQFTGRPLKTNSFVQAAQSRSTARTR